MIGFLAPGYEERETFALSFATVRGAPLLTRSGLRLLLAAPRALTFLSNFMPDTYEWTPEGNAVITFFLTLMLGLGLAFQLPVVMFILAKLGVASPDKMRSFRKYAVLILLVLSAVITPSTDPFNMAIVAVPLLLLYELGVIIASIFARKPVESPATT